MLQVTTFPHAFSPEKTVGVFDSWSDFATSDLFTYKRVSDKRQRTVLSPAEWADGWPSKSAEGVVKIWFGAIDLDGVPDSKIDELGDFLGSCGYSYILYTTYSNDQKPGLYARLFFEISRPLTPDEWPRFWPHLYNLVAWCGVIDQKCTDVGRGYFAPAVPLQGEEGSLLWQAADPLDVDALLAKTPPAPVAPETKVKVPQRAFEDWLAELKDGRRRKEKDTHRLVETLSAVLEGRRFAQYGDRDETMYWLSRHIVNRWPDADPDSVAAIFAPSLAVMHGAKEDQIDIVKIADKVQARQRERAEKQQQLEQERQDRKKQLIRLAFGSERDTPYTEEELAYFAETLGVPRESLNRVWILQQEGHYRFLRDGEYSKPFPHLNVETVAERYLAPVADVSAYKLNDKGEPTLKSARELVKDCGTVISSCVYDMTTYETKIDFANSALRLPFYRLRQLEAEQIPLVDEWLRLLTGVNYERVLDWLVSLFDLSRPCAAIYFQGQKNMGKSLFADGISRLWTVQGPAKLKDVVGPFNQTLERAPLVFCDETLPPELKKPGGTERLREMIVERTHRINKKYVAELYLSGCLRYVFASNNPDMLSFGTNLTKDDEAAVAERFLFLRVPEAASAFWSGGRDGRSLVDDDLFAKHILWLKETRPMPKSTSRFLVEGNSGDFAIDLLLSREDVSAVCHWCVSYLQNPTRLHGDLHGIFVEGGSLWLNASTLVERWDTYQTNTFPPTAMSAGRTLSKLSTDRSRRRGPVGAQKKCHEIDVHKLVRWAEKFGGLGEDDIAALLQR